MTKSSEGKTYTAINRDRNSWTQDRDGSNVQYVETWSCGHKHRTHSAAQKCLDSMGAAACSYNAHVEDSSGNVYDSDGDMVSAEY